jgi:hypothetical protein
MRRIRPSSVDPGAAVNPKRAQVSITMPPDAAAFFFARCWTRGCQSRRTSRSRRAARSLRGRRRLQQQTEMFVQSVPVTKAPHQKPVYHLVFATRSQYGLWVFGDALARARDKVVGDPRTERRRTEPRHALPIAKPSGTVRRVIYPVGGGERTLKALAAEAGANEARYPGSGSWPEAW